MPSAQAVRGDPLPAREPPLQPWHPDVLRWWDALLESPSVRFFVAMDWWQARDVAMLRQLFAEKPTAQLFALTARASEGLGLTRPDQRRNGWRMPVNVPVNEQLAALPEPARPPSPRRLRDPRSVLRSVDRPRDTRSVLRTRNRPA